MKARLSLLLIAILLICTPNGSTRAAKSESAESKQFLVQQEKLDSQKQTLQELIEAYEQKLGTAYDPFALISSIEEGEQLFQRLSQRSRNGKIEHSPLALINTALRKNCLRGGAYNEDLISWLIDDAHYWLYRSELSKEEFQANLLGLRYALEYIYKYKNIESLDDFEEDSGEVEELGESSENKTSVKVTKRCSKNFLKKWIGKLKSKFEGDSKLVSEKKAEAKPSGKTHSEAQLTEIVQAEDSRAETSGKAPTLESPPTLACSGLACKDPSAPLGSAQPSRRKPLPLIAFF